MKTPPEDPPPTPPQGVFVVREARRGVMGEVALHGEATIPLRPGQVLYCPDDGARLVVKAVEFVNFSDTIRHPINPWLVLETPRPPGDFVGRSLPILEGDAGGLE